MHGLSKREARSKNIILTPRGRGPEMGMRPKAKKVLSFTPKLQKEKKTGMCDV